jgi:hypothetical protein
MAPEREGTPVLIVFDRSAAIQTSRRSRRMGAAVIFEIYVRNIKVGVRRVVGARGQLAPKPQRADIRGILIPYAVFVECLIRNGQGELARLRGRLAHRERIVAGARFGLEPDKLH